MVNRGGATPLVGLSLLLSVVAIPYGLYLIFLHYGIRKGLASLFVPLYGPYFVLIPDKKRKRIFKHELWWIWALCVGFLQILLILCLVTWLVDIAPPPKKWPWM